ncbi:uncharacterized protein EV422DRAFT_572049 [Fimicolochytrium jonesii]|uniref:uncharacterized protein n=1 Tax=Fimicolochytrium jonesii TaxID=1396493 RepID=UPI0022FE2538|nr:uncharacterized protein EV422DRAFT_572049 [Fimicolochytrium jonesii]KAI8816155.1 hypothetical protein EV422DRAFT_572049 [Fimicolochytrium jonesii]
MSTLFSFGAKSPTPPTDPDSPARTDSPSPTTEDETPLTESKEAEVGTQTSCMHFLVKSKLGWIAWKEMEATLYSIFERGFGATRCQMKFAELSEDFGFEVEVPNSEVEKFQKFFKGRALAQEIDMLHGIDPVVNSRRDAKLTNLKKTMGSTLQESDVRSSIETVLHRFAALEAVGAARTKEVAAIQSQFSDLQSNMLKKFDDTLRRFQEKSENAVWRRMREVEREIRESVAEDLAILNMNPMMGKEAGGSPATPTPGGAVTPTAAVGTPTAATPTSAAVGTPTGAIPADTPLAATTTPSPTTSSQPTPDLTTELAQLRTQLESAQTQIASLLSTNTTLQSQLTTLTTALATAEAEITRLKSLPTPSSSDTEQQLTDLRDQITDLRAVRDGLRVQLREAQTERDSFTSAYVSLQREVEILKAAKGGMGGSRRGSREVLGEEVKEHLVEIPVELGMERKEEAGAPPELVVGPETTVLGVGDAAVVKGEEEDPWRQ